MIEKYYKDMQFSQLLYEYKKISKQNVFNPSYINGIKLQTLNYFMAKKKNLKFIGE